METVDMSMDSVPLPQCHNATLVIWNDLNLEQSETLINAPTQKDVRDILVGIFKLNNHTSDIIEEILLQVYMYAVKFSNEQHFTAEKLSAYFSIVKRVHEVCIESPFGNLDETFTYFKDLLTCHSVCCPPYSREVFTAEEVRKISYHVINTYFRHFHLYKYAFTPQVRLDLVLNYTGQSETGRSEETYVVAEKDGKEESEESQEGSDKESELLNVPDKEDFEAERYLKTLITEFLEVEIEDISSTVAEMLQESEQNINNKLEETLIHEFSRQSAKKFNKSVKK